MSGRNDYCIALKGHYLEYADAEHKYSIDGVEVPSITQIISSQLGGKYSYVRRAVLERAAQAGTELHEAIETYVKTGYISNSKEFSNYLFLKHVYRFTELGSELPVILFANNRPVAAGRCDMFLFWNGEVGGADIKCTSSIDRLALTYQLNLYRIAFRQSYDIEWSFLRGIQLKDNIRHFVNIPISENIAWNLVYEYMGDN